MPALANPRWERFALAIFAGLDGKTRLERSASQAYLVAYPSCAQGHSAEAAASRLLRRVEPIARRIQELQDEQSRKLVKKIDLSRERIGRRLHLASEIAERQDNPAALVQSELGIAKVFHKLDQPQATAQDYNAAQSMQDIGKKLLQSIGMAMPDDASIALAIEANDAFIARLEAIKAQAIGTLELE